MTGFPHAQIDTTASSTGNPSQLDTQTGEIFRVVDNGVTVRPDYRFTIEATIDGEWLTIGHYADRATADEIVQIATTEPLSSTLDGETPDSALPFSSFGFENDNDLPFLTQDSSEWV